MSLSTPKVISTTFFEKRLSIFIYLQSCYGLVLFINLEYLCLIETIVKTTSRSILKRNINTGNAVLKLNNLKTGLIIEFG